MTEQSNISTLKKKSLRGVSYLLSQTFIIQLIVVVSTLIQAAYLSQIDFGVFAISGTIISFLSYFTDVGLAGALIQKKADLTEDDLTTTFTVQQILCLLVLVVGLMLSPLFAQFYRLDSQGILLFRILLISFFISSFKTIPAILLERKLDFHKLIIPQIIETIIYNAILTILVIRGFGIVSIMYAAIFRSIVGLAIIFILSPWRVTFGINKETIHELFKFGIPYQANSFIAMAKDDILFLALGRLLPLSSIGYINLAKKISDMPVRMIIDSVTRVTFPSFARMQHDKEILKKALEHTTFGIACLSFPIYISAIFLIQPFINVVPIYQKWEPALTTFYMLCIAAIAASFSSPLVNALSAIGKIRITSKFMILWLVLTWVFVIPLVMTIGFNGFALSLLLVSFTVFIVIHVVQKFIPFSFFRNIKVPFFSSGPLILWYILLIPLTKSSVVTLVLMTILGLMFYAGIVGVIEKKRIVSLAKGFAGK